MTNRLVLVELFICDITEQAVRIRINDLQQNHYLAVMSTEMNENGLMRFAKFYGIINSLRFRIAK